MDKEALKSLRLVAVAYSHLKSAWFPTREAYEAEVEVEQRAKDVVAALKNLGLKAKAYRADRYFMAKLLVDQPDLVVHVFCGEKVFNADPPRKYLFTSLESYRRPDSYHYTMADPEVANAVTHYTAPVLRGYPLS